MENLMYSKLQADNKPLKQEESEQLGLAMVEAGNDLGPTTSYGQLTDLWHKWRNQNKYWKF